MPQEFKMPPARVPASPSASATLPVSTSSTIGAATTGGAGDDPWAWVAQAIQAAAELGIADALAERPLPLDELARRVDADPDAPNG